MSKSFRDRRGRLRSGKHCPEAQTGGCDWCVTGSYKNMWNRVQRRRKRNAIRESIG